VRQPFTTLAWATQIMLAKRTVPRRVPSFEVDLEKHYPDDFEKIIPSLKEVERRLKEVPADAQGMRWIHLKDRVYFYGERTFDVPYDDFISRVDIGHVGQFYRDSLGVTTEVVNRDELGRTIHQGVRVVALPQPNYTAFLGKVELDVYKLEKIDYSEDEQRVWMFTVHSPNGSAVCDDGYMSFSRTADGRGTVVAFLACQSFPIPPLMALARLDRWTWFKTVVTESAYRRFCNVMMKNVWDCYNGNEFHVGRPGTSADPG
jgi:hypothetical protein